VTLSAVPDPSAQEPDPTIAAAVERTIKAVSPPASDAAVVALARKMATTIDEMSGAQAAAMIGQTAPQLLKVLQELDTRAEKRRSLARQGRPNKVSALRAAHAQSPAKRKRSG
jgi:hypothetical protein